MMEITTRSKAIREGNEQGKWALLVLFHGRPSRPRVLAEAANCAEGRGPNARAVTERWRSIFKKAFIAAATRSYKGAIHAAGPR
jgi:hypothetical protein